MEEVTVDHIATKEPAEKWYDLRQEASLKNYAFKVVVEPDQYEDGRPAFRACCPALESIGASTSGDTREEAVQNLQAVLRMIVDELRQEGKPIPPESLADAVVVSV
jgi:predicted RNase H-like HicB family nuclease